MYRVVGEMVISMILICNLFIIVNSAPNTKSPNDTCTCGPQMGQDVIEEIVCKESDIPENGTKIVTFAGESDKVMLVKQEGKLYGIGTKCTHYGVPLSKGALGKGRIRCPAHGACFNLKTGDIEDAPGLDSVPCFGVEVLPNGDVKVCGTKKALANPRRVKPMVRRSAKSKETYIIVGGGASGSSCAEVLRQEAFNGRIIMLTEEKYLPYDRVKANKQMDMTPEKILLRPQDFYDATDIEVMTEERVVKLDTANKTVTTASGKTFNYTKIFLGLGAKANKPTLPNHELQNIFTIRNVDDGNRIYELLKPETKVVIIGSSFISMESAAFCARNGVKSVTVLARTGVPFQENLGAEVGQRIAELFESKGVTFIKNTTVVRFEGSDNKLTHIVLNDGVTIPADVCIAGIGGHFDTEFLSDSGLNITKKGSIVVDEFLQTNIEGVYAGGDVAHAPIHGANVNDSIGHWQLAQIHGRRAAKNMLGKKQPILAVPFFFSNMFDINIRYSGYGKGFEEALTVGSLQDFKFVTYFLKNNQVIAAASIGADPIVAKVAEYLHNGKIITKEEAIDNKWLENYNLN